MVAIFQLFRNLAIAFTGLAELLPKKYATSKGKYWVVKHSICDGSDRTDYFGSANSHHPFSIFVCPDRTMAFRVRDVLKFKAEDEPGHKAWSVTTDCLDPVWIARCLLEGENIFVYVTPDEKGPGPAVKINLD